MEEGCRVLRPSSLPTWSHLLFGKGQFFGYLSLSFPLGVGASSVTFDL